MGRGDAAQDPPTDVLAQVPKRWGEGRGAGPPYGRTLTGVREVGKRKVYRSRCASVFFLGSSFFRLRVLGDGLRRGTQQ